jgi:hypothetical protein
MEAPTNTASLGGDVAIFDVSGFEKVDVVFERNRKNVSAQVEYPLNPPNAETDRALSSAVGERARALLCPGCSDQEVALKRCHGCILLDHVKQAHSERAPPVPRGLQSVYVAERLVELIDNDRNVFIGRRPPRGMPTKKVGVKRTLHRSRYANPFVIAKKGFTLEESLSLYKMWVSSGYNRLSQVQLQQAVSTAPKLPSIDEVIASLK